MFVPIDEINFKYGLLLHHRFRPAQAFQYFSCKLVIIIAVAGAILDFLKILNMGFHCTILGKFHAENEDYPYKFGRVHARTDEVHLITLRNFVRKLPGGNNNLNWTKCL